MIMSSLVQSDPMKTLSAAMARAKTAMTSRARGTLPRLSLKKILPTTKSISAWRRPMQPAAEELGLEELARRERREEHPAQDPLLPVLHDA